MHRSLCLIDATDCSLTVFNQKGRISSPKGLKGFETVGYALIDFSQIMTFFPPCGQATEISDKSCQADSPFPKHPGISKCCAKKDVHERKMCLATLHYSAEELPSLLDPTNEEMCEQYTQDPTGYSFGWAACDTFCWLSGACEGLSWKLWPASAVHTHLISFHIEHWW